MERTLFIDTASLEQKPFHFETLIRPGLLDLSDHWSLGKEVETSGSAELLDREGVRTIRVRGRITASVEHACDLCLKDLQLDFDTKFDLFFYPMAMIEDGGEAAISRDQTEVGFYTGDGVGLADVIREQLLLWLPVRSVCSSDCKGLCPTCGIDRNSGQCDCEQSFEDPRWDGLRRLSLKH